MVELMAAAAVLAIAVMGLMGTITYSMRADMASDETITAMHGAREIAEEIGSLSSTADVLARWNNANFDVPGLVPQAPGGRVGLVTIVQTAVPATPPAIAQTLLDVRITISWSGALGNRTYQIPLQLTNH